MSDENCCAEFLEINTLKDELELWIEKSNELKQIYRKLLIENLEKDVEIRKLKEKSSSKKFSAFENILSATCLEKLRSIGDSIKDDSTFISCALNDIYDGKAEIIKELTLTNRSNLVGKKEMSTENKKKLENLFTERLSFILPCEVDDYRKKKLGKLIRNTIDNIKKKDIANNKKANIG